MNGVARKKDLPALVTRHCALCGPDSAKSLRYPATFRIEDLRPDIFSARRSPDRIHWQLVECESCGMIYSDPTCSADELAGLYTSSGVNYDEQESQIYASYAPILDRAVRHCQTRKSFLEIGGGSGFMLRYGVEAGFGEQIEIEPSANAGAKFRSPGPRAKFIQKMFDANCLPEKSVSLAVFFQMLDHVSDPLSFLENVYRSLEPGGVAVCVTHNVRALSARLLGERSPIYDIEHTYLFHPDNLPKLFAKAGFQPLEAFPISNRYSLRYWLRLAPLPGGIKTPLAAALRWLRIDRLRISLRAGNFAVIAKKES